MIPKLASRENTLFYQITNISSDYRTFDFMGLRVDTHNKIAAQIIRDRTNLDYYKDIDFDITPEELDEFDRQCIIYGQTLLEYPLQTPEQITPTRQYPLRNLSWLELDRIARGEQDMTLLEIEELMTNVYGITLDTVMKDKQILEKHKELKKISEEFQEEEMETEEVRILVKYNEDIIAQCEKCKDALRAQIINATGSLEDINNYMYVKDLEERVFDRPLETREMESLNKYIIEMSKLLNIRYKDKKIYKGVLGLIMLLGTSYGDIISEYNTVESIVNLQ
jgi:hypothetical protein